MMWLFSYKVLAIKNEGVGIKSEEKKPFSF